uniref:Uncharacterized protein n=1 Tax=Micrurus corallinus TaxID=54390 RepID=A0A2D4GU20_MICCO
MELIEQACTTFGSPSRLVLPTNIFQKLDKFAALFSKRPTASTFNISKPHHHYHLQCCFCCFLATTQLISMPGIPLQPAMVFNVTMGPFCPYKFLGHFKVGVF